ncbi:Hpt domain-containing protein, partial [Chamaesiphon sp. GL140_3_metabinner_50]|uniref:Hpt domain-containing protein n=1 Tax=Chamaesiphon sp. GL140_3_metabinner_50 TaxID=2970812 RepID=UPI0025DDEA55
MTPDNSAEAQLQQELREMFLVDTQQQLETYFDTIQQLQPASWIADIQSIYRAIHTIKGGAVTVEANSMLYGAIALEDLLSDLRYLEISPPLDDGELGKILLEAGELLASCLELSEPANYGDLEDGERTQLTIQRLQTLHAQVKARYLPDWNEMKQVHQEFAEQGFDLVVLDLEMELANIPDRGDIPPQIMSAAQAAIDQLTYIGTELELDRGWTLLLQRGERLIGNPHGLLWRSIWLPYFQVLKTCIKNSGEISDAELDRLDALIITTAEASLIPLELDILNDPSFDLSIDLGDLSIESAALGSDDLSGLINNFFLDEEMFPVATTGEPTSEPIVVDAVPLTIESKEDLSGLLNDFFIDEEIFPVTTTVKPIEEPISIVNYTSLKIEPNEELSGLLDDFFLDEEIFPVAAITLPIEAPVILDATLLAIEPNEDLSDLLDDFFIDEDFEVNLPKSLQLETSSSDNITAPAELDEFDLIALVEDELFVTTEPVVAIADPQIVTNAAVEVKRGISIPVPLERLDRSAQQV